MPDPHPTPHPDLVGFLLGGLQPREVDAFEDHAAGCSACRKELDELRNLPHLLDLAIPAVELPQDLRARTLAAVAAEAAGGSGAPSSATVVDIEATDAARRRRIGRRWPLLAAVAVVFVLVVVLAIGALRSADQSTEYALSGASGAITAEKTPSGWRIELDANLPRRDDGTYYEAFVEGPGGRAPVGTFNEADGVVLWSGVPLTVYADFVIVAQPGNREVARAHLDL
jgi:hypothetical protein